MNSTENIQEGYRNGKKWEKRFKFFWALAWEKTTFVVRFSLLMTTFQSVFWKSLYFPLTLLFARYSPLYVSLFLFSFAFPRRTLPILASFLTFLRVFLDSLYAFYFLLSLVPLSLSFQPIFTQNPFSTNLNYNNFLRLRKLYPCRYCCFASWLKLQILKITVQLHPNQFDFPLKTRTANYSLLRLHIY